MRITVSEKTLTVCQPCRATKRKLNLLGLPYEAISADETPGVADELREAGFLQSPVVRVYDEETFALLQEWSGYRPELLAALAGKRS